MNSISSFLNDPSFKSDYELIKRFKTSNKNYQNKLWTEFLQSYSPRESDASEENSRFESHPSAFSSETEGSLPDLNELVKDEPEIAIPSTSFTPKPETERNRSASSSMNFISEKNRHKLHNKITKHLKNGTLDKFEVSNFGDNFIQNYRLEQETIELVDDRSRRESFSSFERFSMNSSNENVSFEEIRELQFNVCGNAPEKGKNDLKSVEQNKVKSKNKQKKIEPKPSPVLKEVTKTVHAYEELRKSNRHIEKCISIVKDIGNTLQNGIDPPDGADDMNRRVTRTKEFTSRFSRVYMYPLLRQLSQINPTEKNPTIYAKFTSIYQLVNQALQAYVTHLPWTVGKSSVQKLKEHLKYIIQTCDKNLEFFERNHKGENVDYVKILKSHCHELIIKIDEGVLSTPQESHEKPKNVGPKESSTSLQNRNPIQMPIHRRLAMYNTPLSAKKDNLWKRIFENSKKPKVASRYLTSSPKNCPPSNKTSVQTMHQRTKSKTKDSLLTNTPISTPLSNSYGKSIQTMIQYEQEQELGSDHNLEESVKKVIIEDEKLQEKKLEDKLGVKNADDGNQSQDEDVLAKLLQLVQTNKDQQTLGDIDSCLANTIKTLQECLNFREKKVEIPKNTHNNNDGQLTQHTSTMVSEDNIQKKKRKEPIITVTGAKNARLICITDDNSITSSTSDPEVASEHDDVPHNSPRCSPSEDTSNPDHKPTEQEVVQHSPSTPNVKINRISRPKRMLPLLPKDYAMNVIQYKLAFGRHHKQNRMYTGICNVWEIIERMSDKMLDNLLLDVTKEIGANELLEDIYNSEFRY